MVDNSIIFDDTFVADTTMIDDNTTMVGDKTAMVNDNTTLVDDNTTLVNDNTTLVDDNTTTVHDNTTKVDTKVIGNTIINDETVVKNKTSDIMSKSLCDDVVDIQKSSKDINILDSIGGKYLIKLFFKLFQIFRKHSNQRNEWWCTWIAFMVVGLTIRITYINRPNFVLWDESHFGKMMGWYINGTFFFDVHPPGGKLLITMFGYLGGYNASHSFKEPGLTYEGYPELILTRVGCALVGSMVVPLTFSIVWRLTSSLRAATFAGTLTAFELGNALLSRLILLDPILLCFIMASFHGLVLVHCNRDREFSRQWWGSLIYTGAMLGCVISVKFIGLFTIAIVGLYTIFDLWNKFGEVLKITCILFHIAARILTLIVLPFGIYFSIFMIHFSLLYTQNGPGVGGDNGAGFYSSRFQMNIQNSYLYNLSQPLELSYGNFITLKSYQVGGVYLHSHNFTYPDTELNQITGYRGKDHNNVFQVLYPDDDTDLPDSTYSGDLERVLDGDWIRLKHFADQTIVKCSKNASIITKKNKLVYAMGPGIDGNEVSASDAWIIEMVDLETTNKTIKSFTTPIRLISAPFKCALTHSQKLPEKWGYGQQEMACSKNMQDPATEWHVEFNKDAKNVDNVVDFSDLKSGIFERFVEAHQVMSYINSLFIPDKNGDNQRPWMWPICYRGVKWYDDGFRSTLLGNPLIFLINFIFLIVAPIFLLIHAFREQRKGATSNPNNAKQSPEKLKQTENEDKCIFAVRWLLLAYLLHYVPFYFMSRVLYYHHYFPALQFSSMITAVLMDHCLNYMNNSKSYIKSVIIPRILTISFHVIVILGFCMYLVANFGHYTDDKYHPDNSTFRNIRFFDGWEI